MDGMEIEGFSLRDYYQNDGQSSLPATWFSMLKKCREWNAATFFCSCSQMRALVTCKKMPLVLSALKFAALATVFGVLLALVAPASAGAFTAVNGPATALRASRFAAAILSTISGIFSLGICGSAGPRILSTGLAAFATKLLSSRVYPPIRC